MSRITITLHIDIPEGARVETPDVDYTATPTRVIERVARPVVIDADGLPPEPPYVAEFPPMTALAPQAQPAPLCTNHGPMKRYPAGVSAKTGKPFNASWRCATVGCTTKPLWDRDAA